TVAPERDRIIPLRADSWEFKPGSVEFLAAAPSIGGITPAGPAMRIVNRSGGAVVARNVDFAEGAIEFDVLPTDSNFASFFFHRQDAQEGECFYLRTDWGAGHPDRMEGVQYNPIIKGVFCWNLLPYYQGNANFRQDSWNHIRILIAGRQALIFVNSDTRPTLTIPRLEGNTTHGGFAFDGQMTIAHLVVRPGPVAGVGGLSWLGGPEGFDPTDNDPRYLRHWQVTQPDTIPSGIDFGKNLMPGKQTAWSPIAAERRGLVNLTRVFGGNPARFKGEPVRRIVWLKTTLTADREWTYRMRLGFTNDVWVFLNGRYLYVDKNYYDEPIMKTPRARVSIENCSFDLPLKAGANELLIGVGNDFFGWGIVARLDDALGVKLGGAE
ncbi:MAG: hypothetical protein Q8932_11460, partial [Bacteroidota bacterium]|nr:hypothetical protein [Bacteroidota bacterium]